MDLTIVKEFKSTTVAKNLPPIRKERPLPTPFSVFQVTILILLIVNAHARDIYRKSSSGKYKDKLRLKNDNSLTLLDDETSDDGAVDDSLKRRPSRTVPSGSKGDDFNEISKSFQEGSNSPDDDLNESRLAKDQRRRSRRD